MTRFGLLLLLLFGMACNNNKNKPEEEETGSFNYGSFAEKFRTASLPYQLTDTGLLNNKDTITIRNPAFLSLIPDTLQRKLFGKNAKVKYTPLVKLEQAKGDNYYVLKGSSGSRKAAVLVVFDKEKNFGAAFPFLIPDNITATTQVSSIDKSFSIFRSVARKMPDDVITEGKDVYVYNEAAKDFTLVMTDILDDGTQELINPIDTFRKTQKYSGDYVKGKRSMVSIRDGRHPKEINFFIHFEKDEGACIGELKGTALFTSSNTAVYRQGGDPCVLELHFSSSSVAVTEVEGCGSHRSMRCLLEGTFPRKKEPKPKPGSTNAKT